MTRTTIMKSTSTGTRRVFLVALKIAAIVFVSASVILGVLGELGFGSRDAVGVILTAALLALVASPTIYWVVFATGHDDGPRVEAGRNLSVVTVTDALTRLMNRRGITMGLLDAMAQAERYNTPLSVALVDADHLNQVNTTLGRPAGDRALVELAGALTETLRMPDKVGRYGGEEFLAVLPHTGLAPARKIAERIRSAVGNSKWNANGKRAELHVSIGVTQYSKGEDLEKLLSRANAAVVEAKRDGGDRVIVKKSR